MISRRRFLRLAAQGTVSCSAIRSAGPALAGESMVEHLLCMSPRQSARLEEGRRRGLNEGPHPPDTDGKSVRIDDKIHFRYSRDGGRTWAEEEQSLPTFVRPAEPVALLHENRLAIVCRSYDPAFSEKPYGRPGSGEICVPTLHRRIQAGGWKAVAVRHSVFLVGSCRSAAGGGLLRKNS